MMKWQNKDWVDQPAHLAVGLIATFVIGQWLSWFESSVIVMAGAFARELWQHDWDWRRVGVLDLAFFEIGCGFAAFFV